VSDHKHRMHRVASPFMAKIPSELPTSFWRRLTIHSERSPPRSVFVLRVVTISSESDSMRFTAKSSAMHILASSSSGTFSSFLVELSTSVSHYLNSSGEVFILSSTCNLLQDVWLENVATIYNHVARDSIPCKRHERDFLADQGGTSPETEITCAEDLVRMTKNRQVINMALHQFERQIVRKVQARGHRTEDCYGVGAVQHPRTRHAPNDQGSSARTISFGV